MIIFSFIRRRLLVVGVVLHLCAFTAHAFTISLHEQGGLTGFIMGGGNPLLITQTAVDHWSVTVQDPRIGNPINPTFNLAFVEPETVSGFTAYNNVQMLSVSPGTATFDVLSDEFSPYSTIVPNGGTNPFQNTDIQMISMTFMDLGDSVPEPASANLLLGGALLILFRRARGQRAGR